MKNITIARNSVTGKIVSKAYAAANPDTTTVETRRMGVNSRIAELERAVEELLAKVEALER